MSFQKLQELDEPVFDQPQDARLERVRWPSLRHVPTDRQPIRQLALGLLIASFAALADGPNVERAASTARSGRSVHAVPTLRFTGLVE